MAALNIQIFGVKSCSDTRKAERFFKERRIAFQAIDLQIKPMSKRELETVAQKVGWEQLIDKSSKRFKEKGLAFMSPGRIPSLLLDDPLLLATPVLRNKHLSTVGYTPEIWLEWIKDAKK